MGALSEGGILGLSGDGYVSVVDVSNLLEKFATIRLVLTCVDSSCTIGGGKINPDRIRKLEAINFEWNPQESQWKIMFERLQAFQEEMGHCKVPKGYQKDVELANWVRMF